MSTAQLAKPNMQALAYRNDRVLDRLQSEYGLSKQDADVLFADTLKFLALTEAADKLSPPARIDLGWHNFILHTQDYADFCQSCFGRFIHHAPGSGPTCEKSDQNTTAPRLTVAETVALARETYGELSPNWDNVRGETCGSNGC